MAKWRTGQDVYTKFIENLAEYVSEHCGTVDPVVYGKQAIPEFVEQLKVKDIVLIHEYLMYITEMRPDIRVPAYVYSGGDRVISVTRYLMKNLDLELAKQYA